MSGPQIWLCLFTFRPIASKQLNGLTTIDTVSWLGSLHYLPLKTIVISLCLTYFYLQSTAGNQPTRWFSGNASALGARGPGFNPLFRQGFYVSFFALLLLCFTFLTKTHVLSQKFAIPFTMLIYLVYLTYCKICDRL